MLERENKELKLQLNELRRKYYGRKKKIQQETIRFAGEPKKKGAPFGHPGWIRKKPDHIDEIETIVKSKLSNQSYQNQSYYLTP